MLDKGEGRPEEANGNHLVRSRGLWHLGEGEGARRRLMHRHHLRHRLLDLIEPLLDHVVRLLDTRGHRRGRRLGLNRLLDLILLDLFGGDRVLVPLLLGTRARVKVRRHMDGEEAQRHLRLIALHHVGSDRQAAVHWRVHAALRQVGLARDREHELAVVRLELVSELLELLLG